MSSLIRRLAAVLALSVATAIAACSSAPAKPTVANAKISAATDVNPNAQGRPSPIHVRVLQLKEESAFLAGDFWALADNEQQLLGSSLVQRLEYDLVPGESKEFELKIAPDARVLAVMAEFADYRNAQWRVVTQAPNKSLLDIIKKDRVAISIAKDRVTIAVGD